MFQKRHYELIAKTLQDMSTPQLPMPPHIVAGFAIMFTDDNPRFDGLRFIKACQPGSDVSARPQKVKVKPRKPATDYLNAVTK